MDNNDTMKPDDPNALDSKAARAAFGKAAHQYQELAQVEAQLAERLVERLDEVPQQAGRVLDLGSGPGVLLDALRKRYKSSEIILLDASTSMLRRVRSLGWRRRRALRIAGSLNALPLGDDSVDLIVSALALPWSNLRIAIEEISRVLKPDGLLLFTSYGPDTLGQLRAAWAEVDEAPHVHSFFDMHDVGDALVGAGLSNPVMDVERLTVTYADARGLFNDLRASGSTNVLAARRKTLTGRGRWQRMLNALERYRVGDHLEITCEVIFGHAWGAPPGRTRQTDQGTEAHFSLDDLRRTLPSRKRDS